MKTNKHKDRFYFIYTVYLYDKRLQKKTALLIQTIKDVYKTAKYLSFFREHIALRRLKKMVEYQLDYKEFEILKFSVERVNV